MSLATPRDAEIIVVGSGLAGLTTASALAAAGHDVLVLEARDRIGGRIDTRTVPGGGAAELGAQVIHGASNPVLGLLPSASTANELGSTTMRADVITADGVVHDLGGSDGFIPPPALFGALHALRRAVGPVMASRLPLHVAVTMLRLPGSSAEALPAWLEQITGTDPRDTDLERICNDPVYGFRSDAEFTIPSGLHNLLTPLITGTEAATGARGHLPVPVLTGWQVRQVGRDGAGVRLLARGRDASQVLLTADSVVLTVPPPIVGRGDLMIEDLPAAQLEAARSLTLAPACAACVPLREPCAQDSFRADLAEGLGLMTWVAGRQHVSVVAKGSAAPRLRTLLQDDPTRLSALIEAARPGTEISDEPVLWHDWTNDPLATGAFTAPRSDAAALAHQWSAPIADRILIAGEAALAGPTSPFLERAHASGLAAVERFHHLTEGVSA